MQGEPRMPDVIEMRSTATGGRAVEACGVRKRFSRAGGWVLDGVDLRADAGTVARPTQGPSSSG
jgi:hypothetical protein